MLDEMRAFVLLAETGSIQMTAERIPLTQPAVTRQIQRLEVMLGTTLLDRRAKPSRLTPAGLAALERCREILGSIEDLKASTADRGEPEGLLRVGVAGVLPETSVAHVMRAARERFPKVALRLTGGCAHDLRTAIEQGRLDAAMMLATPGSLGGSDKLRLRTICREDMAIVASRRWQPPRARQLAAMAPIGWVLSPNPCDVRSLLATAYAHAGLALDVVAEVQSLDLQTALVGQGLGLGIVPARRLGPYLRKHALKTVSLPGLRFQLEVSVIRGPHLGRLDGVVDMLQDELAEALLAKTA